MATLHVAIPKYLGNSSSTVTKTSQFATLFLPFLKVWEIQGKMFTFSLAFPKYSGNSIQNTQVLQSYGLMVEDSNFL